MKVAFFIDTLPPHHDGVVKTICQLIETLEKKNIDFRLFSSFKPGPQFGWTCRVQKVFSLPFVLYTDYRMGFPYLQGVFKTLDAFKPDLIHSVGPTFLSLYGSSYALRRKVKSVASYHTNFISYLPYYKFPRPAKPLAIYLQRRFYNRFDRVLVPSASAREDLSKTGIRNISIWPRGVNLEKFSPVHRSRDVRLSCRAESKPLLLYVGRLVKEKNLNHLVYALKMLRSKGHVFQMVFVGGGPMKKDLQSRIPDAHFTGFLTGRPLSEWYASADLFVFPSITETFGNVVLEAMASGIPALVSNQGGVKELVQEGVTGFVAEPNSPKDLAKKIEIALTNRDILSRMGREARKRAEERSWQKANLALLRCYEQVLINNQAT
jgi:glycosyltransferase involved in cell wall biosynthesis